MVADLQWRHVGALAGGALDRSCLRRDASSDERTAGRTFRHAAVELAARVRQSADVPWSGFVETAGTLQVPDNESFATLAQMLGENTQLRVWWRNADDWRVDRIRSTGETGLFRQRGIVRWVFESEPRRTHRFPRSDCRMPQTCCRQPSQGRCCRACATGS